jgi:hypothetical protein
VLSDDIKFEELERVVIDPIVCRNNLFSKFFQAEHDARVLCVAILQSREGAEHGVRLVGGPIMKMTLFARIHGDELFPLEVRIEKGFLDDRQITAVRASDAIERAFEQLRLQVREPTHIYRIYQIGAEAAFAFLGIVRGSRVSKEHSCAHCGGERAGDHGVASLQMQAGARGLAFDT